MKLTRAGCLAGALALIAILVAPALPGMSGGRAEAHSGLAASSPGAGAIVPESPDEIRLIFTEPLEVRGASIDVLDVDDVSVLTRVGEIDPADPYALVVADPQLPDGVYRLIWRTLSSADGHTAEGFFSFGVGVSGSLAGGPQGMTHSATDPAGVIGRWLAYIGLLLALGLAVFHRVVVRDRVMPTPLARALAGGLLLSGAATLGVAIVAGLEAGSVIDYLFGTRTGALQFARTVVAAVGGAALILVAPRATGIVAAVTGLLGIVLLLASGHTAAAPGLAPMVGQVVHVVGASVWIGGIVGLLALVRWPRILMDDSRPRLEPRVLVPRFSALALVSIGLVALTGVYAAWTQTGVLLPASTEYGRTLIMKSSFAIGALALGGLNYLDGGRMMGWLDGFRNRITVEVMLAATVLVLTAALAITPPVEDAAGVQVEPIPDAFGEVAPGMSMEITPGRPGVNRAVVTTIDALAGSAAMELGLDNVLDGTTTRIPLELEVMAGMDHTGGGSGTSMETADGTVDWIADAIILPPGSSWDTSVRILGADGTELSRQRFRFTLDDDGIDEGQVRSLLDPTLGVAAILLLGGGLGLGLGLGGARLPRCEAVASRIALIGGGAVGAVVGGLIGASKLMA